MSHSVGRDNSPAVALFSKVPEVTAFFWIIKVLATTVGETAADYLNMNLGLGLQMTTLVTVAVLAVVMTVQFRSDRYLPVVYWAAVLLISVTGTLITDNLTDVLRVPLAVSTAVFAVALVAVFTAWYRVEEPCRSTPSAPRGAKSSTGRRSWSPLRWGPLPAISSPRR